MKKAIVLILFVLVMVACGSSTPTTAPVDSPPNGEDAWYACLTFIQMKAGEPIEKAQRYAADQVEVGKSGIFWKVSVYYSYNTATYTCGVGYDQDTKEWKLLAFEY